MTTMIQAQNNTLANSRSPSSLQVGDQMAVNPTELNMKATPAFQGYSPKRNKKKQ